MPPPLSGAPAAFTFENVTAQFWYFLPATYQESPAPLDPTLFELPSASCQTPCASARRRHPLARSLVRH
jgi:hypothetical protein